MDHQQAKLILSSFRPNGSDANDPAFTEALELAAREPELGRWLANERSHDLDFANALAELPIPENLREGIFEVLATAGKLPNFDDHDQDFASALARITPPASLRDDILSAMKVEQKITQLPSRDKGLRRLPTWSAIGLTAAAGIVLALSLNLFGPDSSPSGGTPVIAAAQPVSPTSIQHQAINFLTNSGMQLDRRDPRQENLFQFLASNQLPTPDTLPEGLQNASGVGCKKLNFSQKPASLICFRKDDQSSVVHLFVLRRADVAGDLPDLPRARQNCGQCQRTGWSIASWEDEERAFFLLGKMEPTQLAAIF